MSPLAQLIAEEIRATGTIPFARFMELALYAPNLGYYESSTTQVGRHGDFYTSVSVGSLFGELLAYRFAEWLLELPGAGPLQIVEAGAHDGRLALDVLSGLKLHAPGLLDRLEYWLVEPSPARRARQQASLASIPNVRWMEELPGAVTGVIFANELLDAMPVHSFAWSRLLRRWRERGVSLGLDGRFEWAFLDRFFASPPQFPNALLDVLPEGYMIEICPGATDWWCRAAKALRNGKLLTLDYGGALEELLNPGRTAGSLRGYSRHHIVSSVLERPGEIDITADTNFTDLQVAGEGAGLVTGCFVSQPQFLTAIARELWSRTGACPAHQVRQFQTLTHPEHLGRRFRVLLQGR